MMPRSNMFWNSFLATSSFSPINLRKRLWMGGPDVGTRNSMVDAVLGRRLRIAEFGDQYLRESVQERLDLVGTWQMQPTDTGGDWGGAGLEIKTQAIVYTEQFTSW